MNLRHLLLFILIAFPFVAIKAQTQGDSLRTWTLPTVRVIINSPSEAIGQLLRIENPGSTATSLQDALQNLPGISATTGSKDESNLRLRGFKKNEVKIMVDGRPLNNGYFGNVDLSKLAAVDIKEIQIIKGPASPMFGTGSMGGVVNVITNSPSRDKWLSLESVFRRNNTQDYRISTSHDFGKFGYNLSGALQSTDGFVLSNEFQPTPFENGKVRDFSNGKRLFLNGGISHELMDFHELSFDFNLSSMDDKNLPSSIYERKRRRYDHWLRESSGLSGKFQLSENMVLTMLLAQDIARDRLLEYSLSDGIEILSLDSSMRTQSYSLFPKLNIQFTQGSSLDLGFRSELVRTSRKDTDYYLQWTDNRVLINSAFAQFSGSLATNLILNAALGIAISGNSETDTTFLFPEPALGIEYRGKAGNSSKAALALASAQPTMRQLFSASKGNPGLKPQTAFKAEISHQQPIIGKSLTFSATFFYNRTRNLIDLYKGRYENIYRVDSFGAEPELILTPTKYYQASLSYSWIDYLKRSDYELTETPPHAAELKQMFKLPGKASLTFNSAYRHNRLSQDDGGVYHKLDQYWKHDASLKVNYKNTGFELGIENILDENYQGEYGYPEPGRDFYISIRFSFL